MALTTLICYDISRDGTRARVAGYLQQWGDRIQRSVFICSMDGDDVKEVTRRLSTMINPDTDAVHVMPVCGTCWSRTTTLGQADVEPERPYWMAL